MSDSLRPKNNKRTEFAIEQPTTLMPFLVESLAPLSRNKIKSLLTHRQIVVNGTITTQFDTPLQVGDKVRVTAKRGPEAFSHPMMRMIYEDDHIIVIDKRNGLLSVGTDKERSKTAYYILSQHVKRSDPANLIFIVHRLDRETSGLMMFAKSQEVQSIMQRDWNNMVRERSYVAVVEGVLRDKEGVIDVPLSENKNLVVYADPQEGERAVTRYKVLTQGVDYALVELTLDTGKKNQIRAHMQHIGHPIAGDKKYGSQSNPTGRVCLHARVLNIIHPTTKEEMDFQTPVPPIFNIVVSKRAYTQPPKSTQRRY